MGLSLVANTVVAGGPAVLLTESFGSTIVEEGGNGDTYTLALSNQPTGNVTVTVLVGSNIQVVSASVLTFTTSNWNTPQTVSLNAVDDTLPEGTHFELVNHSVSGGGFGGATTPIVQVTIFDNDRAITDLAVTMQLVNNPIGPGQRISYLVDVTNLSAENALVPFFAMGTPNDTDDMSWVCVADPGASCPMSGQGPPLHTISLAGGTGVSYLVDVTVSPLVTEGAPINAVASVEANDSTDPELSNNSASRTDLVGPDSLFRNGFEL
ncbi:hypothetical protein C7S18_07585 [Ahniella affigens]|uniref:DUF11 domain-containing protein n=2 Tax=Ahniella affigens TaxID=2021234 RepID=A0A2P1PQE7_9GAMM|nr:hypothetical protein C7S18_07585 [Ahniella affigens]